MQQLPAIWTQQDLFSPKITYVYVAGTPTPIGTITKRKRSFFVQIANALIEIEFAQFADGLRYIYSQYTQQKNEQI